ncbi:hypothetical protein [Peribacillus frigoritolerans]|uniref:hypothetical protein n=1 Tax=Peribacillus frigoritolerans TaxID=450367 RepID=UPI000FD8DEEB|nr:hypothetical protein [Peribacillus frigoritolerans]AZV59670.1 hypothetical protein DOZ91_02935 [Peribacillus frigoritolerans]MED4690090.1 hypothetical protein [Peribacillus frigoritolerans]
MLASMFYLQLSHYIGDTVEVATSSDLFEGVVFDVTYNILRLTETSPGYEGNLDIITIPLNQINYVRVDEVQ